MKIIYRAFEDDRELTSDSGETSNDRAMELCFSAHDAAKGPHEYRIEEYEVDENGNEMHIGTVTI